MIKFPLTVIDNFYENPMGVREFALKQSYKYNYEWDSPNIYPGARTEDIKDLDESFFDAFWKKIFSTFIDFDSVMYDLNLDVSSTFQFITGNYDYDWIHQDGDVVFSGVVYLTPDASMYAGTSLYVPNNTFDLEKNIEYGKSKIKYYTTNVKDDNYIFNRLLLNCMFDETVNVKNIFNRCVLYEGNIFHGANRFFGKTKEDARLTQVFSVLSMNGPDNAFPLKRSR